MSDTQPEKKSQKEEPESPGVQLLEEQSDSPSLEEVSMRSARSPTAEGALDVETSWAAIMESETVETESSVSKDSEDIEGFESGEDDEEEPHTDSSGTNGLKGSDVVERKSVFLRLSWPEATRQMVNGQGQMVNGQGQAAGRRRRHAWAVGCLLCGQRGHAALHCTRYRTVEERVDIVRSRSWCQLCLQGNHSDITCSKRRKKFICKDCTLYHHICLCRHRLRQLGLDSGGCKPGESSKKTKKDDDFDGEDPPHSSIPPVVSSH
uniref:CCHC-type domain-containing protein n=1 Tax=Caenorhabditis tropicalis TaxID=1561998 RepID=A0A1I7U683_9PELO